MQFSERIEKVQPSMTLEISAKAQELKASGEPIISLAAGEPDFNTPEFIKKAAIDAIEQNFTHYTPVGGIEGLRKAGAFYFEKYYRVKLEPSNIIFGVGGKQCIYNFLQIFINPGDEVLIPSPYWVSYPDQVKLAGGECVFVNTTAETDFKVSASMLDKHYTAKTKLLILNSPGNPTGAVYTPSQFSEIMEWAINKKIFVLSDEIYDQLIYAPAQATSASHWLVRYPELVAVVNGLSKSFAMTGWRIGFLAAHPLVIQKVAVLQGQSTSNICSISQKAAIAALSGSDDDIRIMRNAFHKRRDLGISIIKTWNKAICPVPQGAFYFFINMSGYYRSPIKNSLSLCNYLLDTAKVACVPGIAFGDDNCIRISYAVSEQSLETALLRIKTALEKL